MNEMPITPADALQYFFKAMREGYASNVRPQENFPFPGWKILTYPKVNSGEGFFLTDWWHTTVGSPFSSGTTTIYWKNEVVWIMHYGGWYFKEVLPFLKEALLASYDSEVFNGGRGPAVLMGTVLRYGNMINPQRNTFTDFAGDEYIFKGAAVMGNHWYRGGWQLPLPTESE